MMMKRKEDGANRPRSTRMILASLAALGGVGLASSCCLPLAPFLLAAGTAGSSAFFVKFRPILLAASALLIGFGFYQSWRAKQCNCQPGLLSAILLWASAILVLLFILYWDKGHLISRLLGEQDRSSVVWDYVAVYEPGRLWVQAPPEPAYSSVPVLHAIDDIRDAIKKLVRGNENSSR